MSSRKNIIGQMRDEVQLMNALTGRDENGAEIITWVTSQKLWANIDYQVAGSKEDSVGARIHSFVMAKITMRYVEGVNAKMKLYANGYEWDIETVLLSHRKDFLTLECLQKDPVSLTYWVNPEGDYWVDPDGNRWLFDYTPSSIADATGITWTDSDGNIWTVTP